MGIKCRVVFVAIMSTIILGSSVGEVLNCGREPTNDKDRYAVAVVKDGTIVGHLPKRISLVCSLFLLRGGSILWEEGVTLRIWR